jgi:predicted Zn-dependent protease
MTSARRPRAALALCAALVLLLASGCGSVAGNPFGGGYTPCPACPYPLTPNYLSIPADVRWRQPVITVAIEHTSTFLGIGNRANAAWAGVTEWQEALAGFVTLERVEDCATADVCIRFVKGSEVTTEPPVRKPHRGPVSRWLADAFPDTLGMTWVTTDPSGKVAVEADVQIAESIVSDQRTTSVVAHEAGHALGIRVHSDSRSDLMFAEVPEHGPTQRDYDSVRSLYLPH